MADAYELSYVYARVCGAFSRAFLGPRGAALAALSSTPELWRAVFGTEPPELAGITLARQAEKLFIARSLASFTVLASCLPPGDRFVDALLRKPEYAAVKFVLIAVKNKDHSCPVPAPTGILPGFDPSAYPDLEAMFREGPYAWLAGENLDDVEKLMNRLDRQYYLRLYDAARALSARMADSIPKLVELEIELQNVVWVQRMARYFQMDRSGIEERIITLPGCDVARSGLAALAFATDRRSDWVGWKWERLLDETPHSAATDWELDVRELELAARRTVFRSVRRALHMNPGTYVPLYCDFKLKEYEVALVSGLFEALAIGSPARETEAFALAVTGLSA